MNEREGGKSLVSKKLFGGPVALQDGLDRFGRLRDVALDTILATEDRARGYAV